MHKSHFLLNMSMLLVFTHLIFSISYLIFAFSLKAFITGGDRFLLQSHIYDLATTVEPLSSGHPRGSALWPLNRGTQIIDSGRRQMEGI